MENSVSSAPEVTVENPMLSLANLQLNNAGAGGDNDLQVDGDFLNSSNTSRRFEPGIPFFYTLGTGEILFLAGDEVGSKFLQESLSLKDSRMVDMVFNVFSRSLFMVMSDQFGRYVFSKLIKTCTHSQLELITLEVTSQDELFFKALLNRNGSGSIKQLIKVVSRSRLLIHHILSALQRLFPYLMANKSGSFIILHCLETLDNRQNEYLHLAALENFYRISCHQQGCISMNNYINEMTGPRRRQLLQLICRNSVPLSKHPYGNFVVQHIIKLDNPEFIGLIRQTLEGHVVDLSMMKGGSHVVEKILMCKNYIAPVVGELLNSDRIWEVASDRFGNYVIQRALKETIKVDLSLCWRLLRKLQEKDLESLRFGCGKNVFKFITGSGLPVPNPTATGLI